MARRTYLACITLLLLGAEGCGNGTPRAADGDGSDGAAPADFGATAAYDRRLVFLGPGEVLPTAAVFDFAALSDSSGVRRGVRARVVDGRAWVALLDAGWEMLPMREPWRLVPHGPLRMTVGEAGELDALIFRDDDLDVRLEPGPTIAEHTPDAGTQLLLRQARLHLDDQSVPGVLLDAQLGRAVPARFARRSRPPAPVDAGNGAGSTADNAAETGPPGDAAPTARAGIEALLLDNAGFYAVFAESGAGELAWLHATGRDDTRQGGVLEATAFERFEPADADVGTRWRITAPGGAVVGELEAVAADRAALDRPDVAAVAYVLVTGWIEDRGVRRDVYGLVRQVR